MESYTSHVDGFARERLPPPHLWPEFRFDLPELQYPERINCAAVLIDDAVAEGHGKRIALYSNSGNWSYSQLLETANRIANVLRNDMGVVPGNRVLLRGPNNPTLAACWLAVIKAGAIAVTTMPLLHAHELSVIAERAQIDHAFCDSRFAQELQQAARIGGRLKNIVMYGGEGRLESSLARQPSTFGNVDTARDDVCLLAFTSGSFRATALFTSPTAYRGLLPLLQQFDLASLKRCISAGEPLPRATSDAWFAATGLRLIDGIGATELIHIFISAKGEQIRPGATGKPLPGYQACILDAAGRPLPPGKIGRLAVKGPTGCRYLDDPRQRDYVHQGWNITGDLYSQDEAGYFRFEARADDMIISSGYNIAGPEVEAALLEHPAVRECAVIGVPDADRGHIVKAFVVLNEHYRSSPDLAQALQQFVKQSIAPYKYPRAVEFMAALPKTATGKLQRHALRNGG